MPRLSTLSNPTGLVDLDRKCTRIVLDEGGSRPAFSLVKLDLAGYSLPSPLNVVVIARKGNSEERVDLGPVSEWKKGFQTLTDIGESGAWAFRVLLVQPHSPKLIAAAENIRPEGQGDSSSFIALEPADLGQRPWEIIILELEGRAIIQFNREIYTSSAAAEADSAFMWMLLPEAVRRVAEHVAADPARLSEEHWAPFKSWLAFYGITEEPEVAEGAQSDWCAEVVAAFCNRFEFANKLKDLKGRRVVEE